jgi:hypothetical protein
VAVVQKLAKGGDVVAGGGPGQRSIGALRAGPRPEQRGAQPEQMHDMVHHDLREALYAKRFAM